MITQEYLKSVVTYDPETGHFIWIGESSPRRQCGDRMGTVLSDKGYLRAVVGGRSYLLHRLAWLYVYGRLPCGFIDHINHDTRDNRIENLRSVDRRGNGRNMLIRSDNSSGAVGVYRSGKKWVAQMFAGGASKYLGTFGSFDAAAKARREAEDRHGFHENHGSTKF